MTAFEVARVFDLVRFADRRIPTRVRGVAPPARGLRSDEGAAKC